MSAKLLHQSKLESAVESVTNTVIGFAIALCLNGFCFWLFDLRASFLDNLGITLIMTLASLVRGYAVRRWFNHRHVRRLRDAVASAGDPFEYGTPYYTADVPADEANALVAEVERMTRVAAELRTYLSDQRALEIRPGESYQDADARYRQYLMEELR